MPRSTLDQAIVTGGSMAIQDGVAALTHDSIEALAHWARPTLDSEIDDHAARRRTAAVDAGAWVVGWGLRIAFKQRPGERLNRGAMRTVGLMVTRTSFSGLTVAALQEMTAAMEKRTGDSRLRLVPVAVLGGAGVAAIDHLVGRR